MKRWLGRNIWIWSLLGSILLWLFICMITGRLSFHLLFADATLASFLMIISMGQMMVITSGDGAIDLSIPFVITLASYVGSSLSFGLGAIAIPGLLVTILVCMVVGLVNGLINIYMKVPAMVTTLAVGYIIYSITMLFSATIPGYPNEAVGAFARFQIYGISPVLVCVLVMAILVNIVMYRTRYGIYLHAVGQNRNAARMAGIPVNRIVITTFMICSAFAALSGILLGGYFGGSFRDMGSSYLMPCIASTIIGGTLASGGKSSVIGTICGALFWTLLSAFLTTTQLTPGLQMLIQGVIIVLILAFSVSKKEQTN